MNDSPTTYRCHAFTLIEMVIVIVIISVLSAIAIPRLSIGAERANEAELRASLRELRQAIEIYKAEHRNALPASTNAGALANAGHYMAFYQHILWYTRPDGHAVENRDDEHYLGPYLNKLPILPVGDAAGSDYVYVNFTFGTPGAPAAHIFGWEFELQSGQVRANCAADEIGSNDVPYYQW